MDPNIFCVANEAMLQDMPLYVYRLANLAPHLESC